MLQQQKRPMYQQPVVMKPPRKERRFRFRKAFILVPLTVLILVWVLRRVQVAVRWDDVLSLLHVKDGERYTELACLAVVLIGIVAVSKVLRSK